MSLWVDGKPATADDLAQPAVVNYGHFTAMQIRRGSVRGLAAHLRRIDAAHQELFGHGLDTGWVRERWAQAAALRRDCYLRASFYDDPDGTPHVLVALRPPAEPSATPQRLRCVTGLRAFAHLKHAGTFAQTRLGHEARQAGYDDALLVTGEGEIAETTIANIGFVGDGQVSWPTAPALPGIAWQLLAGALPAAALPSRNAPVRLADLPSFQGAFVANSIGVVPVGQIDGHRFADPATVIDPVMAVHRQLPWDRLAA